MLEESVFDHLSPYATDYERTRSFYSATMAGGGPDNGAPGIRPHYHADYYGAFVIDPDGNNIEAVFHGDP